MLRAPLWLTSLLALVAVGDGARIQQQSQHRRRLEDSTTATGRMDAHPPFRLFQALTRRYEVAAAETHEVDVSAFSSTVFSGAKSIVVASEAGGDDEPSGDDQDENDDDGFNFVAVRTHKPVPECTPRPKRVPRTPVITAAIEDDEEVQLSRDQDSVETPSSVSASESQSDSDSSLTAAAGGFQPLSSANFTASSIIASEATSSPNATLPHAPGSNSSVNAGVASAPALNTSSSAPGSGNSSSDSVSGATNQTGSFSNSVSVGADGGATSSPQVVDGAPPAPSQPTVSPVGKPDIVTNSPSCVPISVEGDATYCAAPANPKSGTLSCSGAAPIQASTSSAVDLNRICPRKGDAAIEGCHPALRSFNVSTKSCIAPEDSRCIVIHTGVWGCSFSFSSSSDGQIMYTSTSSASKPSTSDLQGASSSSSIAVQTLSAASSRSVNQTREVIEATAGKKQQPQHQNASTVPGSLLIVAGVLAIALAVLAIVKRKRAQRKVPPLDHDAVMRVQETYLSYPKTPELSKTTESIHSFT